MIEKEQLKAMAIALRQAYARGENVMEFARRTYGHAANTPLATLIAYDLQAGSYIRFATDEPDFRSRWCNQVAALLAPLVGPEDSVLEVGCGEATTLSGVVQSLQRPPREAFGFDISWSRCAHGTRWLHAQNVDARLFVADLFHIPLEDESIDVVYTSHSLEPNGGREVEAIRELLRVARRAVVLIEPAYEFASEDARRRMVSHGYVRNLKGAVEELGAQVVEHRLLEVTSNPLNPSGVVNIVKNGGSERRGVRWRCPITQAGMTDVGDAYVVEQAGLAYPVLRGIPLLRGEHAVIASALHDPCRD